MSFTSSARTRGGPQDAHVSALLGIGLGDGRGPHLPRAPFPLRGSRGPEQGRSWPVGLRPRSATHQRRTVARGGRTRVLPGPPGALTDKRENDRGQRLSHAGDGVCVSRGDHIATPVLGRLNLRQQNRYFAAHDTFVPTGLSRYATSY